MAIRIRTFESLRGGRQFRCRQKFWIKSSSQNEAFLIDEKGQPIGGAKTKLIYDTFQPTELVAISTTSKQNS